MRGREEKASPRDGRLLRAGALVSEHRLRNGLRVLVAERHADPVVAAVLYYRVGSRDEREDEAGVSHFLEHMMFKGTQRWGKGEIDRVTTELGGQNNAFTGTDHTGYWFELASDRWERALELEGDRMRGLLLDPAELAAEREVVLEELAMGEDDPWRVLSRQVEAALFPRHPYGRPIIGFEDTLRGLTPGRVRAHYERYYRPENATLVLAGDLRRAPALRAARRHFGSIRLPAAEPLGRSRPPAEPEAEHRITTRWDDGARRLCMAWPTAPVASREDFVLDLVASILSSGRGARLYRRLVVDEGLATSVATHNDTRVGGGAFWLFAECAGSAEPAQLEAALEDELERLARERVAPAELRRSKTLLAAADAYGGETVTDLAEHLGEFAVDADWRLALDGCVHQASVRARELQDVAARFLRPERRVVGWCLPRDAVAAGEERARSGRRGKR